MEQLSGKLRVLLLLTDIGFLLYWCVSALAVIPPQWLFKDYSDPILQAWNWSFLPLDLLASGTGLWALSQARRKRPTWRALALVSCVLTFVAGLMAISFWSLRHDLDWLWWFPNLYLMIWPMFFLLPLGSPSATSRVTA